MLQRFLIHAGCGLLGICTGVCGFAVSLALLLNMRYLDALWNLCQSFIGQTDFQQVGNMNYAAKSVFAWLYLIAIFLLLESYLFTTVIGWTIFKRQGNADKKSSLHVMWADMKERSEQTFEYYFFEKWGLDRFFKYYFPGLYYRVIVKDKLFKMKVEDVVASKSGRRRAAVVSIVGDATNAGSLHLKALESVREACEELKDRINDLEAELGNDLRLLEEAMDSIRTDLDRLIS